MLRGIFFYVATHAHFFILIIYIRYAWTTYLLAIYVVDVGNGFLNCIYMQLTRSSRQNYCIMREFFFGNVCVYLVFSCITPNANWPHHVCALTNHLNPIDHIICQQNKYAIISWKTLTDYSKFNATLNHHIQSIKNDDILSESKDKQKNVHSKSKSQNGVANGTKDKINGHILSANHKNAKHTNGVSNGVETTKNGQSVDQNGNVMSCQYKHDNRTVVQKLNEYRKSSR